MWFPLRAVTGALGALLLSAHVQADVLEEKLSFGQKGRYVALAIPPFKLTDTMIIQRIVRSSNSTQLAN